uniref:Uncharacterized protein n=1 Tax=Panagrolaimus sp. ES5 TaxID=591445 RepID=A0AC34G1V9_9BILA
MATEEIPISLSSNNESNISIASETVNSDLRKIASAEAAIEDVDEILATNSSMFNSISDGLPNENAYKIYQTYLKANDLTEDDFSLLPDNTHASHMLKENIVQWIENGEGVVHQKAKWEVTSRNSLSTLESLSLNSGKDDYGIREHGHLDGYSDEETIKDVASLASVDESDSESDFSDAPIIHKPHSSGPRESIEETMNFKAI